MTIKERSLLTIIISIVLSLILILSNNFFPSYYTKQKIYTGPSLFNEIITQIESEYIDKVDHDVLINSAIAHATTPILMAKAFKDAVISGRNSL